jgi:hypothetical protein
MLWREVVEPTTQRDVSVYHSACIARFAFQACSFNHSDISPFRINHLGILKAKRNDLCPDCALTVSASPHILAACRRIASWIRHTVHGRLSQRRICHTLPLAKKLNAMSVLRCATRERIEPPVDENEPSRRGRPARGAILSDHQKPSIRGDVVRALQGAIDIRSLKQLARSPGLKRRTRRQLDVHQCTRRLVEHVPPAPSPRWPRATRSRQLPLCRHHIWKRSHVDFVPPGLVRLIRQPTTVRG